MSLNSDTCHIQPDCVGRRPSTEWLVRLKPEVIVPCIAELHHPDLHRAARVAAPCVADKHNYFLVSLPVLVTSNKKSRSKKKFDLIPRASAIGQADLVGVGVVNKLPPTLRRDTEPHDPLHRVTCIYRGFNYSNLQHTCTVTYPVQDFGEEN